MSTLFYDLIFSCLVSYLYLAYMYACMYLCAHLCFYSPLFIFQTFLCAVFAFVEVHVFEIVQALFGDVWF